MGNCARRARPGRSSPDERRLACKECRIAHLHRRDRKPHVEFASIVKVSIEHSPGDVLVKLFDGQREEKWWE